MIGDVVKNSPASKGGIEIGDIIIKFDGKDITSSSKLKNIVSSSRPDKRYKVELLRDGKKKKYFITLEELPDDPRTLAKVESDIEYELGFLVEDLTTELLTDYDISKDVKGVVVTAIDSRSAAFSEGLRPGDVITRVGQKNVESTDDYFKLLNEESRGDTVLLLVKRKDVSRFMTLEM